MSNRTLPPPNPSHTRAKESQRQSNSRRQTARLEGRRDGKPIIFGWGKHLTRAQKGRLQHVATYGFFGLVLAAVVFTLAFGWLQQTVLIPNETFATVNGTKITQDQFRRLLAFNAQGEWNTLEAAIQQQNALTTKIQQGDTAAASQMQPLSAQIQTEESGFQPPQITADTSAQLVENQLILNGMRTFEQHDPKAASQFQISASAVATALKTFKAGFPAGETYSDFLSKNHLVQADVTNGITLQLRRQAMQKYLAALLVSPTKQVHLRHIETNTAAAAQHIRTLLTQGHATDQLWSTLAKQDSLDPGTKNTAGDQGWIAPGTGDAGVELWAFAAGRTVGEISPVIHQASGSYDVVQIVGIDPSRVVSASLLSASKTDALDHWLSGQKVAPANRLTTPSTTMTTATRNYPVVPDLNATLPNESSQTGTSSSTAPGGLPGGVPGGSPSLVPPHP